MSRDQIAFGWPELDATCAAIVARYESWAGEIEQRLVAMMER